MSFKGMDWTELAEHWKLNKGLEHSENHDEDLRERTEKYIRDAIVVGKPELSRVACDIRNFLEVLLPQSRRGFSDNKGPVWQGLLNLKDNETLLKFTEILLEEMWT